MAEMQEAQPCPVCGVEAEPDMEDDMVFFECENDECDAPGYQWGFRKAEAADPDCAINVPEDIRRANARFDPPVEIPKGVPLGSTIGLRPGL